MKMPSSTPPHLFRCPISLEVFEDPVTLCTGQTYDRPFIEKWLSSGNHTCPVTMQKLTDISLLPNLTLIKLIHHWLDQTTTANDETHKYNHSSPINHSLVSHPEDCRDFLSELKQTLESAEPNSVEMKKKLQQVKALSLELPVSNRGDEISLVKLGFFPVLIKLAFLEKEEEDAHQIEGDFELVELALTCAVKLMPFCEIDCLNYMIKLEVIIGLMNCGSSKVVISLSHLIETILSSPHTKELAAAISTSDDVLRCAIHLVSADKDQEEVNQASKSIYCEDKQESDDDGTNVLVSEAGVRIILALCSNPTSESDDEHDINYNRITVLRQLVKFKALQSLTRCVSRARNSNGSAGVSRITPAALKAVELLLRVETGRAALMGEENGVKVIVGEVFRVKSDHEGSEYAVNCLIRLCCCNEAAAAAAAAREEAVRVGVLTQLLLLLQSQCSGRTKMRARLLLKLLRGTWVTNHHRLPV